MRPRHNPEASSTVMLPPAACSGRLHSWREVTFTRWTVLSLCVKGEAAEHKQLSFTGFSWKLNPGSVSPSIILLCAASWRGVPITYRHQESSLLWKPLQGPVQEFMQSYTFQLLGLIMSCFCSPNSTWILDAYVIQKNSKEFLPQIFPWRHGCRSHCSQQEMNGKSFRTVFGLSLWICSKTHWNKKETLTV